MIPSVAIDFLAASGAVTAVAAWACLPLKRRALPWLPWAACFAALTGATFGLYVLVRSPYPLTELEIANRMLRFDQSRLQTLKKRIAAEPRSPEHWKTLGDLLISRKAYPQAAESYRQATLLSFGEPEILMGYVRSLLLTTSGEVTPEVTRALDMLEKLARDDVALIEEIELYRAIRKRKDGNDPAFAALLQRTRVPPYMREMLAGPAR